MNANQDFAQTVKALRKYHRLTLTQLARKSGISKGLLFKIENGKGNPTLQTVQKICFALPCHFQISPGA
jgi:transcriptional regulator with XRE-family HTH domain